MHRRKRFTLMPAIALAALGLMVAVPTLSGRLDAASSERFTTVTVAPGDTLWALAAAHTRPGGDVQEMIDRISETNRLPSGTLLPGQHLRIPQ